MDQKTSAPEQPLQALLDHQRETQKLRMQVKKEIKLAWEQWNGGTSLSDYEEVLLIESGFKGFPGLYEHTQDASIPFKTYLYDCYYMKKCDVVNIIRSALRQAICMRTPYTFSSLEVVIDLYKQLNIHRATTIIFNYFEELIEDYLKDDSIAAIVNHVARHKSGIPYELTGSDLQYCKTLDSMLVLEFQSLCKHPIIAKRYCYYIGKQYQNVMIDKKPFNYEASYYESRLDDYYFDAINSQAPQLRKRNVYWILQITAAGPFLKVDLIFRTARSYTSILKFYTNNTTKLI